jgi:hypothetical protein
MSLEYYLYCKRRYNNIIICLEEIINDHELIFFETSKLDIDVGEIIMEELNLIQHMYSFNTKLKYLKQLKNICHTRIKNLCKHEYEEDMIDITPDRSEKIIYCKICEDTK